MKAIVVSVIVSVAVSACAARKPYTVERTSAPPVFAPPTAGTQTPTAHESLETFMAKVRKLAAEARPPQANRAETIETRDPRLAAALLATTVAPGPDSLRAVAREYRRLQIVDKAHEYLNRALALDRHDAATYDELARLWRDSGMAHVGLSDAHRAVYYAPRSPIVRNTLGTVLEALGQRSPAREQYEMALRLDPGAAYALNNLCYGWILDAQVAKASAACRAALSAQPDFTAARHNLAILYGASGELASAKTEFEQSGDAAAALYNVGVLQLARRDYKGAAASFKAAHEARPTLKLAFARMRQAQALARTGVEE